MVIFPDDITHQIRRVLRLKDGDRVLVLDNEGWIYETTLQLSVSGSVEGVIVKRDPAKGEPSNQLSLYIGLTQREKFEWILQKGTELGVTHFVPFISERSLVQKIEQGEKKTQRWQKILCEAAEQCRRGKIPQLENALSFSAAVTQAIAQHDCCIIPWEDERQTSLRMLLEQSGMNPARMALMIGPEGGFSSAEVQFAKQHGFWGVTLGPRILRMETAAIAAAAMIQYHMGQME
jgi:16S rRNA (uracil1498-N3)-methyltransferase